MLKAREKTNFALESLLVERALTFPRKHFQRDATIVPKLVGSEHDRARSAANPTSQAKSIAEMFRQPIANECRFVVPVFVFAVHERLHA